jgi:hypothetical protein
MEMYKSEQITVPVVIDRVLYLKQKLQGQCQTRYLCIRNIKDQFEALVTGDTQDVLEVATSSIQLLRPTSSKSSMLKCTGESSHSIIL